MGQEIQYVTVAREAVSVELYMQRCLEVFLCRWSLDVDITLLLSPALECLTKERCDLSSILRSAVKRGKRLCR